MGLLNFSNALRRIQRDEWAEALPYLRRANELMVADELWFFLALCSFQTGDQNESVRHALRYLEVSRITSRRLQTRNMLKNLGRLDEAAQSIRTAIENTASPHNRHMFYVELVNLYIELGDQETADSVISAIAPSNEAEWILKLHLARWEHRFIAEDVDDTESLLERAGIIALSQSDKEFAESLRQLVTQPQGWALCGPFTGGTQHAGLIKEFPIEKESIAKDTMKPQATYEGAEGPVSWQPHQTRVGNLIDLKKTLSSKTNVVGFAKTTIVSPKRQRVNFFLGSDDGVRVWLNGKMVFERLINRACVEGEEKFSAILQSGENELLIKVDQGQEGWEFSIDAFDTTGRPANVQWKAPKLPK